MVNGIKIYVLKLFLSKDIVDMDLIKKLINYNLILNSLKKINKSILPMLFHIPFLDFKPLLSK